MVYVHILSVLLRGWGYIRCEITQCQSDGKSIHLKWSRVRGSTLYLLSKPYVLWIYTFLRSGSSQLTSDWNKLFPHVRSEAPWTPSSTILKMYRSHSLLDSISIRPACQTYSSLIFHRLLRTRVFACTRIVVSLRVHLRMRSTNQTMTLSSRRFSWSFVTVAKSCLRFDRESIESSDSQIHRLHRK